MLRSLFTYWAILVCISFTNAQTGRFVTEGKAAFELYQRLHQQPELGKKETGTAALLKEKLMDAGFTEFHSVAGLPTAVIAVLDTRKAGPVVALRAEMDARPDSEATGLAYASNVPGIMHSCGHDAHAAMLCTVALYLKNHASALKGKYVFVFQPAEEVKGGADDIVNTGILKQLGVEKMFALHAASNLDVGTVGISPGFIMAGSNYFTVQLSGKGGHAAAPHETSDLPVATSELVTELAALPARQMDVTQRPCIISTTYIQVGKETGLKVLPATSVFKGTIRFYEDVSKAFGSEPSIEEILRQTVAAFCQAKGITGKFILDKGSPPTQNNANLFQQLLPGLQKSFSGVIDTAPFKSMFAEDFSYYTETLPCLYFGWGIRKANLGNAPVHSNKFTIHPDAFQYGVELMIELAIVVSS